MSTPEARATDLGLVIPIAPTPLANYVPWVRTGHLLFISGQLPMRDGILAATGKLGAELTIPQGQQAAALCLLNILAQLRAATGSLDHATQLVRLGGFIAATPTFTDLARVMDGASDLAAAIFADRGRHARATVGVAVLPNNAPVEIEALFALA